MYSFGVLLQYGRIMEEIEKYRRWFSEFRRVLTAILIFGAFIWVTHAIMLRAWEKKIAGSDLLFGFAIITFLVSVVRMFALKSRAQHLPEYDIGGILQGDGQFEPLVYILVPCEEDRYDRAIKGWACLFLLSTAAGAIYIFRFWLGWPVILTATAVMLFGLVAFIALFAFGILQLVAKQDPQ